MATTRIKDLTNTATTVASDEYLAIDGTTNGTSKITRDNFRTDTAAAFVAAPGTYNLAPLSGGAVPIDKGGTAATTASAARTNLGVPSNAEAVLVANNLSDVTAATARTNLSVNSIDENAEATGTKLVGPALYFDGVNDYIEFADDGKWSFTDGTDDLPFSISAWVKASDLTNFVVAAKYGASDAVREWFFWVGPTDKLQLNVKDASGGNTAYSSSDAALTSYEGDWIHVCVTRPKVGPNGLHAFSASEDGTVFYVNGVAVGSTATNNASYTGQQDTSQALWVGRQGSSTYAKGYIKDVKVFNRELTAAEVVKAMNGDLGFADEWGGAIGGVYTSDFSAGVDGWALLGTGATDGNIDSIGGQNDNLRLTADNTSGVHGLRKASVTSAGKRYRISFDYYLPSGQSNIDGFSVLNDAGSAFVSGGGAASITNDAWTRYETNVLQGTTGGTGFRVYATDGGSTIFADAAGDDVLYIRNVKVTEIGTLADLRAENYDESTGKLYDESSNAFVGVNSGATLTGRAFPYYKTGTWTPSLYYSGTSAATYSAQSGYYTRIGNTVYVRGSISVSGIGASSGAVSVAGLPFTPSSAGASSSVAGCYITSAANLTSQPIGLVGDGVSQIALYDAGATGNSALDETNITASSVIKVSATYEIQ